MSYYYNYYIGYELEGKIYPFGPYNSKGRLCPVISRSSSFASDLHRYFNLVSEDQISKELRDEFEYTLYNDEKSRCEVKYLPVRELPVGSPIKRGYFLIDEVQHYEREQDSEVFSDCLSPTIYAVKYQHQLRFGRNVEEEDAEGFKFKEPDASDYMYYAYEDTSTEEWEASKLWDAAEMLNDYDSLPKGAKIVILEDEG